MHHISCAFAGKCLVFLVLLFIATRATSSPTEFTNNTQVNQTILVAPSDVSLKEYNVTEFIILISNVTNNLTLAQSKIVLTDYSKVQPAIVITFRSIFILFFIWLFVSAILLRNYEPVKSKLLYAVVLLSVNVISQVQGIIENLPMMRLYFESYWNKFINERNLNSIDAQTFYMNNLDSKGIPTWMRSYANFESTYCFITSYVLTPFVMMGLALYSIQMVKLMLLIFLKDRITNVEQYWSEFKQKQLEKLKNLGKAKQETDMNEVKGPRSIVDQDTLNSTSTSSARPSITTSNEISLIDDNVSTVMDGSDDEVISLDGLSERGRFLNFVKIIIRYRVIEIIYVMFWGIISLLAFSTRIFLLNPRDTKIEPIFNDSWKSMEGYCNNTTRTEIGVYGLVIAAILFLIIPVFLIVDCIVSLVKYIKVRKENKESGIKTENFLVYHFYETDPFVYRSESLIRILFDVLALVIYVILTSVTNTDNTIAGIIISLIIGIVLQFFGGSFSNPGITIYKTYYNYILAKKKSQETETSKQQIQNLQELMASPVSSFSVDYVINRRVERQYFYQFLKQEFSVENLLFVEDLQKLRKINERNIRAKVSKIKEMVKLYLSENSSVFEVNIPSKIIQTELKDFRDLTQLMNQHGIQLNNLPRNVKEGNIRHFPQLEATVEDQLRKLLETISKPDIFSTLSFEVYKNLMDSFQRFKHSRKWIDFVKSSNVKI